MIKKLKIVKQVMMRKSHLKLLKLSKKSTINHVTSSDDARSSWEGPMKILGYIRKIAEGAAQGYEMDQKVLYTLIDKKSYNRLTNHTLNIKAILDNEIEEIYSPKKSQRSRPLPEGASLDTFSYAESVSGLNSFQKLNPKSISQRKEQADSHGLIKEDDGEWQDSFQKGPRVQAPHFGTSAFDAAPGSPNRG